MRYLELLQDLQNLTNEKLTDRRMMSAFGLNSPSTISYKKTNNSFVTDDEIEKVERYFNVSLASNGMPHFTLDYFPDVFGSCGNGVFQFSTKKEQIKIPESSLFKKFTPGKEYFVINAYGNSMQPYILDKDKLIVENYGGEQIIDNRPYVFAYKDEIFIKRLAKNVDQLMIIPENKDYDIRKLTGKQLEDVTIIGQIVGIMRDLR